MAKKPDKQETRKATRREESPRTNAQEEVSHAYNHGPKELETIEEEHDEDEIDAGSQSDEDMPNLKKE